MNAREDVYTHGHAESVLRSHRWRTAENSAGYLLPRLQAEARILDVGCGPGTITLDLARRAERGSVIGLDRSEPVIDEARETARQGGVANVDFTVGDVYALEYDADTFDVVHAHQVLQHLSDPVAALREMGRVCKPEGVVAVRDSDYAGFTWWPAVPELDEWLRLYREVARGNGAEPDAGRRLKSWALAAGLEVVSSSAGVWGFSSAEDVAWWGGMWADRVVGSALGEQARERGLASAEDLDRLAQGWREWAASADAWFAVLHGELLCSPGV
jgi:2-polyprenyl-3-methyl-5-hydroxy-6-metoxy-1,4-benzoquinol methylase